MAPAKHESRDISIAYKALALHRDLTGDFKSVGAGIMDHLNQKTGQCDPSLDRLARMLGMSEKNVRRATAKLCDVGMFTKKSHGGKAGRASYTPMWKEFRSVVGDWQDRMRTGAAPEIMTEDRTELSGWDGENDDGEPDNSVPTTGQFGPVVPDRIVRQTNIPNQTKNQRAPNDGSEGEVVRDNEPRNLVQSLHGLLRGNAEQPNARKPRSTEPAATPGCSRSDASRQAAQRRLNKAVGCTSAQWQSDLWTLTEPADWEAALVDEEHRHGMGILCLDKAVKRARVQQGGDRHAR